MVDSISGSEAYQEFELRNNRLLNMLADNVCAHLLSIFRLFILISISLAALGQEHTKARLGRNSQITQ